MKVLDEVSAERFVTERNDARWDGWDIVLFQPTPAGATHKRGAFRDGVWGLETRVKVNTDGKWRVNVRPTTKPRN